MELGDEGIRGEGTSDPGQGTGRRRVPKLSKQAGRPGCGTRLLPRTVDVTLSEGEALGSLMQRTGLVF